MSTLTPPNRKLEAWKYVTPSLLKDLANYQTVDSTKEVAYKSDSMVLHAGKIVSHDHSTWKDTITTTAFSDLSDQQKESLKVTRTDPSDCFSELAYESHTNSGLWVDLPKGSSKEALEITIVGNGDREILNSRLHFHIPKLSEHQINIRFIGLSDTSYANLLELTFNHEAGSKTNVCVLGEDAPSAMTLTGFYHDLKRDSHLSLQFLNGENKLTRHRIQVNLNEENAEAEVIGLGSLSENGTLHNFLNIHHNVPHCRSKQLFKSALGGKSRSSFDGTIQVAEKAIDTEANQLSRYLLLSPEARANAKPQLKIYNDDVVCAHGSTIGQLEEEELFYLQTRGLSKEQSHHLLARGFVEDILAIAHSEEYANLWRNKFLNKQFPL